MAGNQRLQVIPTQTDDRKFDEIVLTYLSVCRRVPAPKLSLNAIFNYVLRLLYLCCQWKELPIKKMAMGGLKITTRRFIVYGDGG